MGIQFANLSGIGALVVLTLGHGGAEAAQESVATQETLDEVLVRGARLQELRAAVIEAEDRMLARYNELNQVDDLDIECIQLTPTGTHLKQRYCLTRLQKRAQQRDSAAFLDFARDADTSNGQAPPLNETGIRLMERSMEYRENLTRLLQDHPELRQMLKERGDAQRRYEAARRERFNKKNVGAGR
jgi:hypothetical protein